jgi:hypothetical protein
MVSEKREVDSKKRVARIIKKWQAVSTHTYDGWLGSSSSTSPNGFQSILQYTCKTEGFDAWGEDFLIKALNPGQVVMMDTAAFHKSLNGRENEENLSDAREYSYRHILLM